MCVLLESLKVMLGRFERFCREIASLSGLMFFGYFWWHGGRALRFHLTAGGHPSRAPGQGEGACDARLALGSDKALPPLKVTLTPWKLSAGAVGCQLLWTCHGLLSTLMMTTARGRPAQHCMRTGETPPSFLSPLTLFFILCASFTTTLYFSLFYFFFIRTKYRMVNHFEMPIHFCFLNVFWIQNLFSD